MMSAEEIYPPETSDPKRISTLLSGNSTYPQKHPIVKTGLKKIQPYWYTYSTRAKGRWFDREILELVSTEFRDRSVEYYRYALESGVTTVNGRIAKPGTIVRNGDLLENLVHRHEPPVTTTPVQILLHDVEREFIVINKPGSIPVHAAGRYFKQSLVEILKDDFGFERVFTVNRLDRLTSGLMIVALSSDRARELTDEFTAGRIKKEYVARVKGKFPSEQITCEEPLLTVDRQMGLNIVHPEGKSAQTIFTRLHYDPGTDTSVLHCQPLTGRSHQLRVHLQYLGFPIANDPVYSDTKIWGKKVGKGGIDLAPSEERSAPVPPPQHESSEAEGRYREKLDKLQALSQKNPAWRTKAESQAIRKTEKVGEVEDGEVPKLLPRETGHDIGMGSPVPLSLEAVGIITRLRNQKDEDEDWSRWRDVIFRAKAALNPVRHAPPRSPQNRPRRGNPVTEDLQTNGTSQSMPTMGEDAKSTASIDLYSTTDSPDVHVPHQPLLAQPLTLLEDGVAKIKLELKEPCPISEPNSSPEASTSSEEMLYCPECYLPLHPDPKPEKLYIFLHALRYTTSLGSFETEMPDWAAPGWEWDRSP